MEVAEVIRVWIIIISGFRQDVDEHNGCQRLEARLRKFASHKTVVLLRGYNADFRRLAQRIVSESSEEPRIVICGYSFGCGRGARLLAHYLDEAGFSVSAVVASDPIAHTVWFVSRLRALIPPRRPNMVSYTRREAIVVRLRWLAWMLGRICPWLVPTIDLPANVIRVVAFRQSRNLPMGHDLEVDGSKCCVTYWKAGAVHDAMDDLTAWHEECERVGEMAESF